MNGKRHVAWIVMSALALGFVAGEASALTLPFTYQGQLKFNGVPYNGEAAFAFQLFGDEAGGDLIATTELSGIRVVDGLFTAELTFEVGINGRPLWLQIHVRAAEQDWTSLEPRQPINPAPYAIFSYNTRETGGQCLWNDTGNDIFYSAGNVGIGTSTPSFPLHVTGTALAGIYGETDFISGMGVQGRSLGLSGGGIGVMGESSSPDGFGGYFVGRGYFSENVGIGTTSPGSPLTVAGLVESTTGGFKFPDGTVQTTAGGGGSGYWSMNGSNLYYTAGRVGVGTNEPDYDLHVVNTVTTAISGECQGEGTHGYLGDEGAGVRGEGGVGVLGETDSTIGYGVEGMAYAGSGTTYGVYGRSYSTDGRGVQGYASSATGAAVGVRGEAASPDGYGMYAHNEAVSGSAVALYGETDSPEGFGGYFVGKGFFSGNVGIGTATPNYPLHVVHAGSVYPVVGENTAENTSGYLGHEYAGVYGEGPCTGVHGHGGSSYGVYGESDNYGVYGTGDEGGVYGISSGVGVKGHSTGTYHAGVWAHAEGAESSAVYAENTGGGVGLTAKGAAAAANLYGNVTIYEYGTANKVIELGKGLDYAEGFDVSSDTEVTPGTVLVIDPASPGRLAVSTDVYDSKVAGIVAGAQGLGSGVRLGAGEFDHDVALAGRVYCNVDASKHAVEAGDLLTTSSTPGHAMKVIDRERAQGAILGKAMQSLNKGEKGQILVLVTLQ
jgi:hypothetical protein